MRREASKIHVRGLALECALGRELPSAVDALERGEVRTTRLTIDALEPAVEMPFYRVGDGAELGDPRRYLEMPLRVAREALRSAGLSRAELERTALFIGTSSFAAGERDLASFGPGSRRQLGFDPLASELCAELGLVDDAMLFNTACTASAVALVQALRMLRLGQARNVLVLGIEICNRTTPAGFAGLQLVSEALRPFDRRRSGIVLGEGVGGVLLSLEPGPFALELRGGATVLDHFSVTTANPDGSSIELVQRAALADAGVEPREIRAINAHGTSSPMNDVGEAAGILRLFGAPPPVCGLKSYVGHTLGACGALELALFGAALLRGFVPNTALFGEPDPELGLRPTECNVPAPEGDYLLNYFGFGGNNTSLVLTRSGPWRS